MDFLGIGPVEILVILIVALLVFGPEKLVDVSKTVGKTVSSFKKAANDMTTQVTKEIEEEKAALKRDIGDIKGTVNAALPREATPLPAQTPPPTAAAPVPPVANQADNAAKDNPPAKGTSDK